MNHVLQMWATVHGLIALLAVGRLEVEFTPLRTIAETAINDVLARAPATPARRGRTQPPRQDPS